MSFDSKKTFDKCDLDKYLQELGKEYRRLGGRKMPAEIILIGGASILVNYGFRDTTTDIDALISAASTMKEAIRNVGEKNGLSDNWLNTDFVKTASFSTALVQHSVYYKTFANVLSVRTVAGEYLVAMKLMSGRKYKFDLSDVLGVLADHEKNGKPISAESIKQAAADLYGSWDVIPEFSREYLEKLLAKGNYEEMYSSIKRQERINRNELVESEWKDSQALTEKNAKDILAALSAAEGVETIEKDKGNGSSS